MDLTTTYLGLSLKNPIVCGACPLGATVASIRQLEDAGVAAVVLPSLFEEEIQRALSVHLAMEATGDGFAEATGFFPEATRYRVGPDDYLELVHKAKAAVKVPIIASLNGASPGGWTDYATKIAQAGADAIELNVFYLASDAAESGAAVDQRTLDIVTAVRAAVKIPVAVKLSPYYSSVVNLTRQLESAGADGVVLFNRFYQADIDIEALEVVPNLRLSSEYELLVRLRWLAILSGQVKLSLAATGGAHTARDVIKAVMAGAHVVQMVSALLIHGPTHLTKTLEAIEFWMREHEYESIGQMLGSMNLSRTPNPAAFARANYAKILDSWEA
jgi:dihydroorotate dehydrogenase (fumarate)